jgi:hypothetical protein
VNWAARWGGGAALLCIGALFILSWGNGWLVWYRRGHSWSRVTIWRGQVGVFFYDDPNASFPKHVAYDRLSQSELLNHGWRRFPCGFSWEFNSKPGLGWALYATASLWPIGLAAGTAAVLGVVGRTAHMSHPTCPSCSYDLSGLPPGSPCPECAAVPAPPVGSRR